MARNVQVYSTYIFRTMFVIHLVTKQYEYLHPRKQTPLSSCRKKGDSRNSSQINFDNNINGL